MFCFVESKHSSSCILKCNSFYLIIWGGVMSFLTVWVRVSWFTCCQEWDILNPPISLLDLSCVMFHLKPSLRNVAIMVLINDPRSSFILRSNKFLVSLFISIQSIVSVSGRISPHSFEMFSISPLQPCSFVVGVPTTPLDPSPKDAFSSSFVA